MLMPTGVLQRKRTNVNNDIYQIKLFRLPEINQVTRPNLTRAEL